MIEICKMPIENSLCVSIVLFNTPEDEVRRAVDQCLSASSVQTVYLLDNSAEPVTWEWLDQEGIEYIFNNANLGYGTAHNIALRKIIDEHPYALVLNADVLFEPSALDHMVAYMHQRQDIGLLSPKVLNEDGTIQRSIRLLPTPVNMIVRRFFLYGGLFALLRRISPLLVERKIAKIHEYFLAKHIYTYELGITGYNAEFEPPVATGCFMLFASHALKQYGLFDERFFMYNEDIDLTRRISCQSKICFTPEFQVVHAHARGSYKNLKLFKYHIISQIKYFAKWGWFFDKQRESVNKKTLKQCSL